jgi:uncharacterized membrane protein
VTLVIGLKFFHYLALFLAGGLGVANGLLASAHLKTGTPPAPPVQRTMMILAKLGLVAVIILWISGIGLMQSLYGGVDLGWAFHMKMFGAAVLLGTVSFLNYHLASCAKQGTPPNPKVVKVLAMFARGSLVLVLLGIAIVTTS